jgi:hypothetical protein
VFARVLAWVLGRSPRELALFAALLCAPSLGNGLQADDHALRLKVQREHAHPLRLFYLGPESIARGRANGALAWWTSPEIGGEFLRPLASLVHTIELRAFRDASWPLHAVNIALYALCVWLAAGLYRELLPSARVGGLAALLFAIDEAHAISVGWMSALNTLLALAFALSALALHVRARHERRSGFVIASAACTALALLAGEAGVWALAFALAYALAHEKGPLRPRLTSVAPQLAIGALWAAFYLAGHYAPHGTSLYRDPAKLSSTLAEGVLDLPLWLTTLFGPSVVGLNVLVPEPVGRLWALPTALAFGAAVAPVLWRSAHARFFALVTALALAPLLFTLPSDRTTLGASFGAFGWIACALTDGAPGAWARLRRGLLITAHVVLALLAFQGSLRAIGSFERGRLQIDPFLVPGEHIMLLRAPTELMGMYALAARQGLPNMPASLHTLYTGGAALQVERIDARTLELSAARGWGYTPIERLFCAKHQLPGRGEERRLPSMTVRVLESTAGGAPQRVRFELPEALDARRWLIWNDAGVERFALPKIGERVSLPALDVFRAIGPG